MQKMALFKLIYTKPLIGLVLSVLLLNLQFSLGEKNYFENLKHSNEMLNCGRVISSCAKGENELFIGYKFNKPVEKWERCSWIVAIPNATRFTIEPVLNGLKNQAAGLLALGINDKDDLVSHDLDEGISRNITVNANYLHIIFWTNGLPGSRGYPEINGFVLRVYVETATSSNTTLLPRSRVHLLAGDVKEFVHPASLKQNDAYLSSTEL